jgi:hypothetical protein
LQNVDSLFETAIFFFFSNALLNETLFANLFKDVRLAYEIVYIYILGKGYGRVSKSCTSLQLGLHSELKASHIYLLRFVYKSK